MSEASDRRWMGRAKELARSVQGRTAPNPPVGAVLVRDGVCIGEGATQPAGRPHAEPTAIANTRAAGNDPRGSTMYVTLEPCCHYGRTAPCTEAILEAGLRRVVVGLVDPFPAMQGKALEVLRQEGVQVDLQVDRECSRLVRGFTRALIDGLPEVTCKAAITLDGRIATARGESQWITGPEARAHGHELRATHDAILVGSGTQRADNPRLTCRLETGVDPVPVVLDTSLGIEASAAVFASSQRPILICAEDAPRRVLPAEIVRVRRTERGVDIGEALRCLAARGLHRVLVEGGGDVHRSLLDAGLVANLLIYMAGMWLPGGRSWLGGPPLEALADAVRLGAPQVSVLGRDVLLSYDLGIVREAM